MPGLRPVRGRRGTGLLEQIGYRIFIVPGSSFIKRMVKKYKPKAIMGVGCLAEVKEGIDMADKMGLVVMGVVTLKEGCVETVSTGRISTKWPSSGSTLLQFPRTFIFLPASFPLLICRGR